MENDRLNLTEFDFTVADYGTIVLLTPENDFARGWIDEHLYSEDGDGPTWFGGAVAIDHRCAGPILEGLAEADAVVRLEV